jgi:hypothetical protein
MNMSDNPFLKKQDEAKEEQMEAETSKRSYKPRTPNIESVIRAIDDGEYDEHLSMLSVAIAARLELQKEKVMEQVRLVFGKDAEVVVPQAPPFRNTGMSAGSDGDNGDEAKGDAGDPLAHLDDVERQMAAEQAQEPIIPAQTQQYIRPEQRGAVISGLHSSHIAD